MVLVVASACVQPEPAREEVEALSSQPNDLCVPWVGRPGYCFTITTYVFTEGRCRGICDGSRVPANATFFANRDDCAVTCACRPEKFTAPADAPNPFRVGGSCGEFQAIADVGEPLWEGCLVGSADQRCPLGVSGELDTHGFATLCEVSSYPSVRQIVCVDPSN